uniref:Uncharacterized protein n=1 Tax=Glossina pallidipes TaxID=7398 RepID=A0A1A9Z2S2_GLOPL
MNTTMWTLNLSEKTFPVAEIFLGSVIKFFSFPFISNTIFTLKKDLCSINRAKQYSTITKTTFDILSKKTCVSTEASKNLGCLNFLSRNNIRKVKIKNLLLFGCCRDFCCFSSQVNNKVEKTKKKQNKRTQLYTLYVTLTKNPNTG